MGIVKYKTLAEARQRQMEESILGSIGGATPAVPEEKTPAIVYDKLPRYKSGLYRFRTWEDARRFDMDLMIRGSRKEG